MRQCASDSPTFGAGMTQYNPDSSWTSVEAGAPSGADECDRRTARGASRRAVQAYAEAEAYTRATRALC
jgi:hypothetical protein